MAKYFDKREGRLKSIPDCAKHGLVWNDQSQRCEKHTGLGYVMDEELFLLEGGGYYELPYSEPVYEAPIVYEAPEPVYIEPEPIYFEPVYEPIPVYEPEPIIAPDYFELPYVEPVSEPIVAPVYEPFYVAPQEQVFFIEQEQPAPVFEPTSVFEPVFEPIAPIPELELITEEFFSLPYVEPIPEPEPEEVFFALPVPPTNNGWAFCASEHQYCQFPGTQEVRYGAGSTWTSGVFTNEVECVNAVFGDPIYGVAKECQIRSTDLQSAPTPIIEPELELVSEEFFALPYAEPTPEPEPITDQFFELPYVGFEPIEEQIAIPEWPVPIEPVSVVGIDKSMYTDDFGNTIESGTYDTSVGGDSFAIDYASVYEPIDFAPSEPILFEPEPVFESFMPPLASEDVPFAPYEPEPLPFEPLPGELPGLSSEELFFDYLDLYLGEGYSVDDAITLAEESAAQGSIEIIPTLEQAPLPEPLPSELPFIPFVQEPFIPEQFFPLPFVPEEIPPAPPLGPCDTPTGLPGVCAQGFYHPINSPCDCVPFPPTPSPTQQPKPPTQTTTTAPKPPASTAPKPPAQQVCPVTHCKHPQTGQCIPIPTGYGRHPQTQVCTPLTAQAAPIPIPTEAKDLFDNLKELPWWVWAAGAGLLLLSQSGGNGERRTTITHRRA